MSGTASDSPNGVAQWLLLGFIIHVFFTIVDE